MNHINEGGAMSNNVQQRINQIGRLIKKYKNMARAANQQRKWKQERGFLEKIQSLNLERMSLQEDAQLSRASGNQLSPRIIKKINVLLNEIDRDTRILGINKANNNVPGVQKYERIVQNKKAKLAALEGRQQQPVQTGTNNNRQIRILLNEIRRDRLILSRHQQAGNAAGVTKYNQIVKNQLALLKQLRSQNQKQGGSGQSGSQGTTGGTTGSGGGATSGSADVQQIANTFKNSARHDGFVDAASNSVIDLLLETRFSELKSAKSQLFTLRGNATPPPDGSVIDQPFIRDVFKIFQSNITLKNYTVKDSIIGSEFTKAFDQMVNQINAIAGSGSGNQKQLATFTKLAHRDAFQLIPQDSDNISRAWSQFAGAKLSNITMENISIHSNGSLQGIFSSDGAFENLNFKNISVDTQSAHQIAILGMLSGTLDLTNTSGTPVEVNLLPLRLGGGRNVYIKSFSSGSSYQYGNIDKGSSNANINDNRQLESKRGTYYTNFDMDNFIQLIKSQPKTDLTEFLDLIESSAARSGDLVV